VRVPALAVALLVVLTTAAVSAPGGGVAPGPSPDTTGAGSAVPPPSGPLFPRPPVFEEHVYHHYPDLTTELQDLAARYPDTSKLTSIGRSVQGRELWQMEITDFDVPHEGKHTVYIDGGHHGNEQLGMEMALQLVHEALYGRLSSPEHLAQYHFFVVPMINPDGNTRDSRTNVNGVDLNRNYDFEWTDESNHGSGPESEPEARANANSMREVDELYGMDLYLSGHTGTNILIYSWAWTYDLAPDDGLLYRIGSEAHNETGVLFGPTSAELYIATGSSKDFAYGALAAPGFTYEVDDSQNRQGTYTTTIAERLTEEIDTCVLVIENVAHYRADLKVVRVGLRESGGEKFLSIDVKNGGWTAAVNASVSVGLSQGTVLGGPSVFTVGADNMTGLVFEVDGSGMQAVTISLSYKELQVNTSDTNTTTLVQSVDFGGGGLGAIAAAGGGVLLIAVAAGAAIILVDRRTGGRLGAQARPAVAALRARLPLRRAGGPRRFRVRPEE